MSYFTLLYSSRVDILFVRVQIENILGFVSKEAKSSMLYRHLHNERENKFPHFYWWNSKYNNNREQFGFGNSDILVRRIELYSKDNILLN